MWVGQWLSRAARFCQIHHPERNPSSIWGAGQPYCTSAQRHSWQTIQWLPRYMYINIQYKIYTSFTRVYRNGLCQLKGAVFPHESLQSCRVKKTSYERITLEIQRCFHKLHQRIRSPYMSSLLSLHCAFMSSVLMIAHDQSTWHVNWERNRDPQLPNSYKAQVTSVYNWALFCNVVSWVWCDGSSMHCFKRKYRFQLFGS